MVKSLKEWLDWMPSAHHLSMDLSLERVSEVARRLKLSRPGKVITVAGTNGKGSCVAGLEAIYLNAGFRVGAYTSPILFKHNEYIRIQGNEVGDEAFCSAFEQIESVRDGISLTVFEFNTLAALILFQQARLDIWLLEVGLGGRYDATNVIDADIAIVTSIGIDHVEWLGDTREKIAYEKAGIFRRGKPAICGDFCPPHTLIDYARELGVPLFCQNKEFGFQKNETNWDWWRENKLFSPLPLTKLALQNMSTVLMAVDLLQDQFPVSLEKIKQALSTVSLTGRIQVFKTDVIQIMDVSHNPASAEFLVNYLKENPNNKTRAVFSMLKDKDILTTILTVKNWIDEWYVAPLMGPRAASREQLNFAFQSAHVEKIELFDNIEEAFRAAIQQSKKDERIVVFGSFHTVAAIAPETFSAREFASTL